MPPPSSCNLWQPSMMIAHFELMDRLKGALASGNRRYVNDAIDAFMVSGSPDATPWRTLATLALQNGEVMAALRLADRMVAASGGAAAACFERGVIKARAGRLQQARDELRQFDHDIDIGSREYTLGTIALELGEVTEARRLLRRAVDLKPESGSAWLALSMAGELTNDVVELLLSAEPVVRRSSPPEQAVYWYAVGRVLIDRGLVDDAFGAFARGAALRRSGTKYDRGADAWSAAAALDGVEIIAENPPSVSASNAIFVTGLPRSGTTLVEQILSAHSRVTGGGELNLLRLLAQDAGGTNARAVSSYVTRGGSAGELAALYTRLVAERVGSASIVVDKSLNLSRFLGIVASTMPQAPIIWVRRNPLDCAWSCFRTHFAAGAAWSLDLSDMAHHFALEDLLHEQWSAVLGSRILTVSYERLVADPAGEVEAMVRHCGLSNEVGLHSFHLSNRAVTTSSLMQVRRPINQDAIDTSAPFTEHLKPFRDAYGSSS